MLVTIFLPPHYILTISLDCRCISRDQKCSYCAFKKSCYERHTTYKDLYRLCPSLSGCILFAPLKSTLHILTMIYSAVSWKVFCKGWGWITLWGGTNKIFVCKIKQPGSDPFSNVGLWILGRLRFSVQMCC